MLNLVLLFAFGGIMGLGMNQIFCFVLCINFLGKGTATSCLYGSYILYMLTH